MTMPAAPITPWEPRPTRADVFRSALFFTLGVLYAILLFPLALGIALLWAVGKVIDTASATAGR
jgi:hypothetical protein